MTTSDIADYYVAERPEFATFIGASGAFAAAIDIGCAGGKLGAELLQRGVARRCDGIEPFAAAASVAATQLTRVWQGSLEAVADEVGWPDYALIVMADVLEHLIDPWSTLRLLHARTSPGCRLALSVPNVRHYKVLLPLLCKGEFRYQEQGIMDRTHLHFFTRASLIETLADCGWKMQRYGTHMKSRYRRWYYPTHWLEPFVAVQHLLLAEKQ
jgi:2-polyprenyl-3-methyl-5-hydroxy-6-metoxy-1,4-benzoquinol methylase